MIVLKKIFDKPVGASERHWCNMRIGTTRSVTCEACGSNLDELGENDESRSLSNFLGLQLVDECCGKVIDLLYEAFGEDFSRAFLDDFSKDPTNPRFAMLLSHIERALKSARAKANDVAETTSKILAQLE